MMTDADTPADEMVVWADAEEDTLEPFPGEGFEDDNDEPLSSLMFL
jgi:hypothetical protein